MNRSKLIQRKSLVKKGADISGLIWISSIVLFLGASILFRPLNGFYNNLQISVFATIVIVGILAFLVTVILRVINAVKSKELPFLTNPFTYVVFGMLVIMFFLSAQVYTLSQKSQNSLDRINGVQLVPTTTQPTVILSPQPINNYVNPDPIINCNSAECGTIKIKQSQCTGQDKYVCCQTGSKWAWFSSMSECKSNQNSQVPNIPNINANSTNTSTKIPVFLSYYGYTRNCPAQNVSAVTSIDSTMVSKQAQWTSSYSDCVRLFQNADSCYVACKAGNINDYAACIATCPSTATACEWTYAERSSLTSEISRLCPF